MVIASNNLVQRSDFFVPRIMLKDGIFYSDLLIIQGTQYIQASHSLGVYTTLPYLGVDLHGEEQPEASMWSEGVKFLLQLDQPLGGEVHVLQQDPASSLRGREYGLLC